VLKHVNTNHIGRRTSTHGLKEEQLTMNPAHRLPLSNACDHCAQSRHGSPQTYSVAVGNCAVLEYSHSHYLKEAGRTSLILMENTCQFVTLKAI